MRVHTITAPAQNPLYGCRAAERVACCVCRLTAGGPSRRQQFGDYVRPTVFRDPPAAAGGGGPSSVSDPDRVLPEGGVARPARPDRRPARDHADCASDHGQPRTPLPGTKATRRWVGRWAPDSTSMKPRTAGRQSSLRCCAGAADGVSLCAKTSRASPIEFTRRGSDSGSESSLCPMRALSRQSSS